MSIHTTKVAVSVPASTFRSVEAKRKRLGRSRSSIVAEALDAWLRSSGADDEDARYLAGYERFPEPEDAAAAVAVMETWDDWRGTPARSKRPRSKRR